MKVVSVGSSSSGNSYIIEAGSRLLILDAGLSCIKITRALESLGYEPHDVTDILITHEHSDHIKSVRTLAGKCGGAGIYASRGTIENCSVLCSIENDRIREVSAGDEIVTGDIRIRAFALSHDSREPVSYSIIADSEKLSVVTDTGFITEGIYNEVRDADMMVLEANHDEHLLMYGEYPYHLKQRIKSDSGHLSNRAAGELLAEMLAEREDAGKADESGALSVMLAHLSFHNNTPFTARDAVEDILKEAGFERERHYTLTIASRDELTVLEHA